MSLEESTFTWQNNLVRIAFFVTFSGLFIIFIFIIAVLANADSSQPGAIASPLILCAVVVFLVISSGLMIVREQIKRRLPRIRVINIVITLIAISVTFGVKSFIFGWAVGFVMIASVFLLKEFNSRMRGIAVCAALICLVIAQAIRMAGGYDSGGTARYAMNIYAFASLFLPALLAISTLKKLPLITSTCCFGFLVLTLHSAVIVCSGVKTALDEAFGGEGQPLVDRYEEFSEQYCIVSSISSPVGLLVDFFQSSVFPDYVPPSTTTMPFVYVEATTTTTTFDCSLLNQEYDANDTNFTNFTDLSEYLELVDLTHCYPAELVENIDPNSTTTVTTSTTETSSTSTSTTSTTTTSTTTTSTTSTSTTSTLTTTSTTSTSTSSTTTTNNETKEETTTSTLKSTTRFEAYMLTPSAHYCPPGDDVLTARECRIAANDLGLKFGEIWTGAGDHKLCAFADDNREQVYFNNANSVSPYAPSCDIGCFKSVCHTVTPWKYVERCTHKTPEGLEEIEVSSAGYWAIGVLAASGLWVAALWFVLILVGVLNSGPRVHPEPDHHHHHGQAPDMATLTNMTEEEIIDTAEIHEIMLEKKRVRRLRRRCKRNCRRCCRATRKGCGNCKQFKHMMKQICKFILKTNEAIIGTAVFVSSAIAIIVVGGTQMPKDKPFCAREPRLPVSLLSWAEEPAQRYAVVWCEYGAFSAVGLGFIGFCCFLLAFSMSFIKVNKYWNDDRIRKLKATLKQNREKAAETGEIVEMGEEKDYGPGFRIQNMIPREEKPRSVFEDYDGRIFDV